MTVSTLRAVFRTTDASHFANSFLIINRTKQLQGYKCYHSINRISKETVQKGVFGPMGWNKKRKTGTPVWRQISTQSSSSKEFSVEATVAEPANIANIEQGKIKTDEAEATAVSPNITYLNDGLKDSEDALGDSSTASVSQNIVGGQDSGKMTFPKHKHAVTVEVGASVMRFIRGKDGSTQKGIEEMGVKIEFPPMKMGDSIVIGGDSMDDIAKASQKIQSIIDEAAKNPDLTYSHFISLPLAIHPEFVDKVTRFRSSILGYDPKYVKGTMECTDGNPRTDASVDAGKVDQPEKDLAVGVKLKIRDDINPVKVDIRNIPTVSYAPKATKSATLFDLRIDDSLFLKPQRLHLTVLMLKLWNKERIHAALEVLQDLIRGSKERAQVLYAPIEEIGGEGRLTSACLSSSLAFQEIITDAYVKAGLVLEKDAEQKLKHFFTVAWYGILSPNPRTELSIQEGSRVAQYLKSTYVRLHSTNSDQSSDPKQTPRLKNALDHKKNKRGDSFDARGIFQQFGKEEWGEYHIREAHLSQRFVYDDNDYYHCCASIPLPENSQVHEAGVDPAHAEFEKTPMANSA
ncbi:hypothetical protein KSS87_003937 [Heliosperma pusillum]|nr:hypothetical protein KSS87_001622 [Heliosperma pusillum]KAH9616887.1 hypothetical protein KSS87_003937 [Heliosperma pusillum]